MADRDLPVKRLMRILRSFGSTVEFSANGYVKAWRSIPSGETLGWMQHCHRGIHDTISRQAVRIARRRLRLRAEDGTSDETFYSAR